MPPQKTNETFEDALRKVYTSIAQLALYPDADLEFVTGLQQVVQEKLRYTNEEQMAAPATPDPSQQAMQQQAMMAAQGQGGPSPMGGPMPGLSATGGGQEMPPMDELARVLGSQPGVG